MKTKIALFIVASSLLSVSCVKKNQSEKFDYGTYENGIYTNTFFDFALTVPAEWYVFSQDQNLNLVENSDNISEDNTVLQQTIEKSKVTTTILLTASQYGLDVPDSLFNPNIMLIAENIHGSDKIKSASDYLLLTRHALEQDPSPKEFPFPAFKLHTVNSRDFSWMRVVTSVPDHADYTQDYYVILQNEFALTAILTYNADHQRTELEHILNTFTAIPPAKP